MTSSKSNIKHETIDTNTLDSRYETVNNKSIEFARASKEELETKFSTASPTSQARLSGERPLGSEAQRESGNVIAPALRISDFTYACLSLHHYKKSKKANAENTESRRRQVNLDFKLQSSGAKFNKLKFTLTWKPSEFLKNIPEAAQQHRSYSRAMAIYKDIREHTDRVWIGKGNLRKFFDGGPRSVIKENTSMVLYEDQGVISGYLWVEDAEIEFEFDTLVDNNKYYFMKCEPIKVLEVSWAKTGGWV